jgi:hypothetical protein
VTEWNEFRRPDFARMRTLMRTPVVVDGRNIFTPEQMSQHDFTYYSMGRRPHGAGDRNIVWSQLKSDGIPDTLPASTTSEPSNAA